MNRMSMYQQKNSMGLGLGGWCVEERDNSVVCPKPRRLGLSDPSFHDHHFRPSLRWPIMYVQIPLSLIWKTSFCFRFCFFLLMLFLFFWFWGWSFLLWNFQSSNWDRRFKSRSGAFGYYSHKGSYLSLCVEFCLLLLFLLCVRFVGYFRCLFYCFWKIHARLEHWADNIVIFPIPKIVCFNQFPQFSKKPNTW